MEVWGAWARQFANQSPFFPSETLLGLLFETEQSSNSARCDEKVESSCVVFSLEICPLIPELIYVSLLPLFFGVIFRHRRLTVCTVLQTWKLQLKTRSNKCLWDVLTDGYHFEKRDKQSGVSFVFYIGAFEALYNYLFIKSWINGPISWNLLCGSISVQYYGNVARSCRQELFEVLVLLWRRSIFFHDKTHFGRSGCETHNQPNAWDVNDGKGSNNWIFICLHTLLPLARMQTKMCRLMFPWSSTWWK